MIAFGVRRIYLCRGVTDMRKSFDTLASVVLCQLGHDPRSGDAFVFVGRRKNRLKVLLWERDGYWVLAKRLAVGVFALPTTSTTTEKAIYIDAAAWSLLLAGITIQKMTRSRRIRCIRN